MKFDLGMSRLKNGMILGVLAVVAIGIFLNLASPVSAQNAVPTRPDAPTVRALHLGMVVIDWNDVPGAREYEVQFWGTDGWIDVPDANLGIEAFFYGSRVVVTGLPRAYSYDAFQVRAGNNQGWSGWSDYGWIPTTHNMDWEGIPVPEMEPPVANTPATGGPAITGATQVGETLTASPSGIADADGLDNVSYSYQWIRNDGTDDTDITGATSSSYTLVDDDEGKAIKVKVSFTDDADNDETLTSTATATVAAKPNSAATGAPTISGTAEVGQTLTADTSGISDSDGLDDVSYSYQWIRNDGTGDTDISTATSSTYTVLDADEGKTIKVRVSFTDDDGNAETLTSAATSEVEAPDPQSPPEAPNHGNDAHTYHVENGENWVSLRWIRPSGTVDGYKVFRQRNSRLEYDFRLIATINDPSITEYNDYDVEEGSDNYYQIRAFNKAGDSPASDLECGFLDSVTTEGSQGLEAPDRASARLIEGGTAIRLTWSEPTEGYHGDEVTSATGYQILRWDRWYGLAKFELYVENTGTTSTSFIDRDILPNNTYTYVVRAWNDWGLGDRSYHAVVDTGDFDAGDAPSGVRVTTSDAGPKITWSHPDDVVATEVRYRVFRHLRTGAPAPMQLLTSNHEGTSYVDITAAADTGYYYSVGVYNGTDEDRHGKLSALRLHRTPKNYPATGVVAITGATQVGETLTASTSGIADADGLDNVSYSYQWIRNDGTDDTDITGATSSSYTLVDDDEGKAIKVKVSFTDDADNDETLTSTATATVAAKPNSAATGAPTISGTAEVGQTLTADTSGIADADGLAGVSFNYQWLADDADIASATASTYLLTTSEVDKAIEVRVSFTDEGGSDEVLTSAATAAVSPAIQQQVSNSPATGAPTISGTAQVGQTLTADTSGISDSDGLDDVSYSYQWIRNDGTGDTDISTATSSNYTLVDADEGKTIKVRVSFTDDEGNAETLTSAATVSVAAAPVPLIVSLTSEPTSHDGTREFTFHIQFSEQVKLSYKTLRDHAFTVTGGSVKGAGRMNRPSNISWRITIQPDGNGAVTIVLPITTDCEAAGAVCTGDGRKLSSGLSVIVPGPVQNSPATGAPTISGTAQVGQTLTADTSGIVDDDGLDDVSYSYQWIRNDGSTDADILGKTGPTYVLSNDDVGKTIKVRVSFTDDANNNESLTSAATAAAMARPNSPATGAPTISGTAQVGETLAASTTGIADSDGLTNVSYSYQWLADDAEIEDATGSTYEVSVADVGKSIKVRVTFTDDRNNAETLTSAVTATVAAKPDPLTASLSNNPASHDGSAGFTFELRFSEHIADLNYKTLRDHAFTVTSGQVKKAERMYRNSETRNIHWRITVEPDGNGDMTIVLPVTTNCDAQGAICTDDGRKLSNRLEFTVNGPTG